MSRPKPLAWAAMAMGTIATAALLNSGCTGAPGGLVGGTFNQAPRPIIRFDRDRGVAPLTIQFNSDRSSDDGLIVGRAWDFGDGGTSSEIAPRHTFAEIGEYTVRLTILDEDGLSASTTATIVVTDGPVAIIDVDRTTAENAPATFKFDASASFDPDGEVVEFEWDFDDGSRETEPTLDHRFARPGTYLVRLTVTDDAGVTGEETQLIAVGIPEPAIEVVMPDERVKSLFLSTESPLWVRATYAVDSTAKFFVSAGIDADRDVCDAQAFVFNLGTGGEAGRALGHLDRVRGAQFLPGDDELLTVGEDSRIVVSDFAASEVVNEFDETDPITSLKLAASGAAFAYSNITGAVRVADAETGDVIRTFTGHTGRANAVDITPGASRVLSGGDDDRAILWAVDSGEILRDFDHGANVNAVAINPADATLVASAGDDGVIRLWNVEGGELLAEFIGHDGPVNALAFTRNGLGLISGGSDATVRIWNTLLGSQIASLTGHTGAVLAVGISPNGQQIVSGSSDSTARIWDSGTGELIYDVQPCESPIRSVAFSSDGRLCALGVAARTGIRLDTAPPNGNDLNLTVPAPLQLSDVELRADIVNEYFVWAEIDTEEGDPVRDYADVVLTVFEPFPTTFDPAALPERISTDDQFDVILPESVSRQVINLGPVAIGDLIDVKYLTNPGYLPTLSISSSSSLMFLDPAGEVVAWYTQRFDDPFTLGDETINVPISQSSRLVIAEDLENLFVVADGGVSLRFDIRRGFQGEVTPVPQRVLIRYDGAAGVRVGNHPVVDLPPFDSLSIFSGAGVLAGWDDADKEAFKAAVLTRLDDVFGDYNVEFFTSDDPNSQPEYPYMTIYFGDASGLGVVLAADPSDPRNPVLTGNGIVFSAGIVGMFPPSPAQFGARVGTVMSHTVGLLLGLRPTVAVNNAMSRADVMREDSPFSVGQTNKVFQVSAPGTGQQVDGLPTIGMQNAPKYLEQVVGLSP